MSKQNQPTKQGLFALVRPVTIKPLKSGDFQAIIPIVRYNPSTKKKEFTLASAFIPSKSAKRQAMYEGLHKGDLIKIDYQINGDFMNITRLFALPKKKQAHTNAG